MALNANDMTSAGSGSEIAEMRTQLPSALISDESVNPIVVVELPNPSSVPFPELYRKWVCANDNDPLAGLAAATMALSHDEPSTHLHEED